MEAPEVQVDRELRVRVKLPTTAPTGSAGERVAAVTKVVPQARRRMRPMVARVVAAAVPVGHRRSGHRSPRVMGQTVAVEQLMAAMGTSR